MKKMLIGMGTIAAVMTPIAAVVSCGDHDHMHETITDCENEADGYYSTLNQ